MTHTLLGEEMLSSRGLLGGVGEGSRGEEVCPAGWALGGTGLFNWWGRGRWHPAEEFVMTQQIPAVWFLAHTVEPYFLKLALGQHGGGPGWDGG